jgi:uncharacterized protein YihD (DUF1040 family)
MTPRDPKRIDKLVELLREAWQLDPDFRLTQLVMVISDKPDNLGALWHVEDDIMEQKLRSFIAGRTRFKAETHKEP